MGENSNIIEICTVICVFTFYVGETIKWLAKIMTAAEVMVANIRVNFCYYVETETKIGIYDDCSTVFNHKHCLS